MFCLFWFNSICSFQLVFFYLLHLIGSRSPEVPKTITVQVFKCLFAVVKKQRSHASHSCGKDSKVRFDCFVCIMSPSSSILTFAWMHLVFTVIQMERLELFSRAWAGWLQHNLTIWKHAGCNTISFLVLLQNDIPEKSEMVSSESTLRFSELSAVPMEASDSRVSSSEARGSSASISTVNSSLLWTFHQKHEQTSSQTDQLFVLYSILRASSPRVLKVEPFAATGIISADNSRMNSNKAVTFKSKATEKNVRRNTKL